MKTIVSSAHRNAKMRAHTATHLLHFLLHQIIPGGTKQAGSLVDNDLLRFDFSAKQALTAQQLQDITNQINTYIYSSLPVHVEEISLEDAKKTGAKAFFEDKYGDSVRVVSILGTDLESVELCGGTHVHNTSAIGAFHIISQESVASGIRRITAYTGTKVAKAYTQSMTTLEKISSQLSCTPKQINEKIEKTIKELDHIKHDYASMQGSIIKNDLKELDTLISTFTEFPLRIQTDGTSLEQHNFKEVIQQAKILRSERDWIIYSTAGNFAIYAGNGTISAKDFARTHKLKGGGSDNFIQGKDTTMCQL